MLHTPGGAGAAGALLPVLGLAMSGALGTAAGALLGGLLDLEAPAAARAEASKRRYKRYDALCMLIGLLACHEGFSR